MFWMLLVLLIVALCSVPFALGAAYETWRLKRKGLS